MQNQEVITSLPTETKRVFHNGEAVGSVRRQGSNITVHDRDGIAFGDDFDEPFAAVRAVLDRFIWEASKPKWRSRYVRGCGR